MIDEILKVLSMKVIYLDPNTEELAHDDEAVLMPPMIEEALTAIYEIGLECIGAAKKLPKVDWDADQSYAEHAIKAQNQLIASQRKAWAKACGVEITNKEKDNG